jgi:N-acetylmuramoyl-L-alanine amidase
MDVSAHYVITTDGFIHELVNTCKCARHAGLSRWKQFSYSDRLCLESLNKGSIGIEFHTPGYANGNGSDWLAFVPFTTEQRAAGLWLVKKLMADWNVPPENVLGHSDIAPDRKTDPGALFPWALFAQENIGLGYQCLAAVTSNCKHKTGSQLLR